MERVPTTILHTGLNLVGGILIGSVTDSVFPDHREIAPGDYQSFLWTLGEVSAQLVASGLVVAGFLRMTDAQDGSGDPTQKYAFFLALGETQPNLFAKINAIRTFIFDKLDVGFSAQPPPQVPPRGINQKVLYSAYQ